MEALQSSPWMVRWRDLHHKAAFLILRCARSSMLGAPHSSKHNALMSVCTLQAKEGEGVSSPFPEILFVQDMIDCKTSSTAGVYKLPIPEQESIHACGQNVINITTYSVEAADFDKAVHLILRHKTTSFAVRIRQGKAKLTEGISLANRA